MSWIFHNLDELTITTTQQLTTKGRPQKKNGKISDIVQKGGRGVESISLFLTD